MGGGKTNLEIVSYGRKNKIKGILIGTILGGIIFGGIGAAAVTLTAEQITYTPSNEEFDVTNAQDALNELYKLSENSSNSNLLVDVSQKYGTGNNSFVEAVPKEIPGYETALFGFSSIIMSGGTHTASITANNDSLSAGSKTYPGNSMTAVYTQYLVKEGTEYIIREYDMSKYIQFSQEIASEVDGYKLVGAVFHISNYSSSYTGGNTNWIFTFANLDNQSITVQNTLFANTNSMTCTAKLLYLPE